MIVKFFARGKGGGGGPVDYLLGRDRERALAKPLRGDPEEMIELIDASPYAKKYTSGVLSFHEADLPAARKEQIMNVFERALLPGLDKDQYSCLWVEHRDKKRLELNFVVPNIELISGKRLQPYYYRADRSRIKAWKSWVNAALDLHDPDDPGNRQISILSVDLPENKKGSNRKNHQISNQKDRRRRDQKSQGHCGLPGEKRFYHRPSEADPHQHFRPERRSQPQTKRSHL